MQNLVGAGKAGNAISNALSDVTAMGAQVEGMGQIRGNMSCPFYSRGPLIRLNLLREEELEKVVVRAGEREYSSIKCLQNFR